MRHRLALLLLAAGTSSCFEGEFLEGTVCRSSSECSPSFLCNFPTPLEVLRDGADPGEGVCGDPRQPEFIESDPVYPRRDLVEGCPEDPETNGQDFFELVEPAQKVCAPACDVDAVDVLAACPQPDSGTVLGACLITLDDAMGAPCGGEGQTQLGERCPGGGFCLVGSSVLGPQCVPALACALPCDETMVCPDSMGCDLEAGLCIYP